jgi:putative DNA primase/helicase
MIDDVFAPLGDGPGEAFHATNGITPLPQPDWQPEMPAPVGPPAAPRHGRLGTPTAMWTYRDAAGRPLFAVCRFGSSNGGGKEVLPLSYGTLRGKRGWY